MTLQYTPRLNLSVDVNGESPIDTNATNWQRVDQVSGVMYTTSTATIPDADLFDGAIIAERDTGISWQAVWNGTSYSKRYISYPFFWVASASNAKPTNNINTEWGWKDLALDQCVNSGKDQLAAGSNGFIVPIRALYDITMMNRWTANPNGYRRSWYTVNGVAVSYNEEYGPSNGSSDYTYGQQVRIHRLFTPGQIIRPGIWQNSGGSLACYQSVYVTIVRPVYVVS